MNKTSPKSILSVSDVGALVRRTRKAQGLTQATAAMLCGVGTRFLSDLENGKPTAHLGKTLQVLAGSGLVMTIAPRGLPARLEPSD